MTHIKDFKKKKTKQIILFSVIGRTSKKHPVANRYLTFRNFCDRIG